MFTSGLKRSLLLLKSLFLDLLATSFAVDGKTGKTIWAKDLKAYSGLPLAVADLDNSGSLEAVVVTKNGTFILNAATGEEIWRIPTAFRRPNIHDVDLDGKAEIIIGNVAFSGQQPQGKVLSECKVSTASGTNRCTPVGDSVVRDIRPEAGMEFITEKGIFDIRDTYVNGEGTLSLVKDLIVDNEFVTYRLMPVYCTNTRSNASVPVTYELNCTRVEFGLILILILYICKHTIHSPLRKVSMSLSMMNTN